MTWILELPFVQPLSLNQRLHYMAKARLTREWRDATAWLARAQKIPRCSKIEVEFHYVPPDARRRDEDNVMAAFKASCDGCVDAGVVEDDTSEFVIRQMPVIHPKGPVRKNGNRFWLVIRAI